MGSLHDTTYQKEDPQFCSQVLVVHYPGSIVPTLAETIVTWDLAVMLASLMTRHEIDLSEILVVEIHEKAFWKTTTLPFPCLIFRLYR